MYELIIRNARVVTVSAKGTMERGTVAVAGGRVAALGTAEDFAGAAARTEIDAAGLVLTPGIVDCHTHLLEYATAGVFGVEGPAQRPAGCANLLTALRSGTTAVGEHHLGHPVLAQPTPVYQEIAREAPLTVGLAAGFCAIGTDPMAFVSALSPGSLVDREAIGAAAAREFARRSDFPGESLFLTATVADLPAEAAPLAGEMVLEPELLHRLVEVFHEEGRPVGAHVEGDAAIGAFLEAGGDVLHHAHGMSPRMAERVAGAGIPVVATPHGGTSRRPLSPSEIADLVEAGTTVALASDSYLPVHPEADWYPDDLDRSLPQGPDRFLYLARPVLMELARRGRGTDDTLALITRSGARILGRPDLGTIEAGKRADLCLWRGVPGLEVTGPEGPVMVLCGGRIVSDRRQAAP